ncbi:trace amine-associated receptor 13c-like [Glandiceps talaboti]
MPVLPDVAVAVNPWLKGTAYVVNYTIFAINFVILLAIVMKQNLRQEQHYFFTSFTVANLIQGVVTLPMLLCTFASSKTYTNLATCLFIGLTPVYCMSTSLVNMLAWTCDLYHKIFYPFHHQRTMAKKTPLLLAIAVVWTLPSIFAMLQGCEREVLSVTKCSPRQMYNPTFITILLRGFLYPCVCVLIGLNLRIIYQAKKNVKKIRDSHWACSRRQGGQENGQIMLNNYKAGRKSTISLIFIILIIVFCWSPLLLTMELTLVLGISEHILAVLVSFVSICSSLASLGPLAYILRHSEFREGIKHVFKKLRFWNHNT